MAVKKHIFALLSISFIFLYNSKPFILGIFMSMIKISYMQALNFSSANTGSLYESTSNPLLLSPFFMTEVISRSSSTTKILYACLLLLLSLAASSAVVVIAAILDLLSLLMLLLLSSLLFKFDRTSVCYFAFTF